MALRNVFMKNFPVISVKVHEGALTRSDMVGPDGGIIEGVVSRDAALVKGDKVKVAAVADATNVPAADSGIIMVTRVGTTAGNAVEGVLVSDPVGLDAATVSGSEPVVALKRVADVAFFGLGIVEFIAGGTIVAGARVQAHTVRGQVVQIVAPASIAAADNGGMLALAPATSGKPVPVLLAAGVA